LATGVLLSAATNAQDEKSTRYGNRSDEVILTDFSRKPARELVAEYFGGPHYPLFVIHRLMELGDPTVLPALQVAFARERDSSTRQFLAAALVRLGDKDPRYFGYVSEAATRAIRADLPLSLSAAASVVENGRAPDALITWAQIHRTDLQGAVWLGTVELPAAVEALGETADRRSFPILLRGLHSRNFFIVNEAALGLAHLSNPKTVKAIISACKRLSADERPWVAKTLLYFDTPQAQRAAEQLIADPVLLARWREQRRRGLAVSLR
jgi:HEAT repeat protein